MRSLRGIATRWPISALCIALIIGPILAALVPTPASAQLNTIKVAVVDFRNLSKTPDEMFSAMGTDAVAVEMLRSGKFDITTADALRDIMEKAGYKEKDQRAPKVALTASMLQRVGEELGVSNMITGDIVQVNVNRDKKTAQVRMAVRMLDVDSGEWINGAVATGSSNPRIGYTADKDTDWVIEAINDAAKKCIGTMVQYIIPEATVLGTIGTKDVLINKGSQDGIAEGMKMAVLRRSENGEDVVAHVRVTKVSDTDAHATIESSTRGVKPEDRVRAVYELPSNTSSNEITAPRTDTAKRTKKAQGLLWGLLLLGGLWLMSGHGGSDTEDVPDTVAMVGTTPDVTSRFGDGGVLIAWNNPKNIATANIMEYHIWRDNVGRASGGPGNVGPTDAPDQVTAGAWTGSAIGSYDHHLIQDQAVWESLPFHYVDADDRSSMQEGTNETLEAPSYGTPHTYYVSCLYRRLNTTTGEYTYWETDPVRAGVITLVQRPELVGPGSVAGGDFQDLSDVTFEWLGSEGANQYVVEVSPSINFERDRTWVSGPITQGTSSNGQVITRTFTTLATSAELGSLPSSTPLYWRVGARNSADDPGPYPAGPSPALTGAKNTRYTYSSPSSIFSFMILGTGDQPGDPDGGDNPPPTPGG